MPTVQSKYQPSTLFHLRLLCSHLDCVVLAAVQGYCHVGTWTFSPVSDPEGGQHRETGQTTVSYQNTGSLGSWKRFFPRLLRLLSSERSSGCPFQNDGGQLCCKEPSVLQGYFGAVPHYSPLMLFLYSCFGF